MKRTIILLMICTTFFLVSCSNDAEKPIEEYSTVEIEEILSVDIYTFMNQNDKWSCNQSFVCQSEEDSEYDLYYNLWNGGIQFIAVDQDDSSKSKSIILDFNNQRLYVVSMLGNTNIYDCRILIDDIVCDIEEERFSDNVVAEILNINDYLFREIYDYLYYEE